MMLVYSTIKLLVFGSIIIFLISGFTESLAAKLLTCANYVVLTYALFSRGLVKVDTPEATVMGPPLCCIPEMLLAT